jgi:hypothetical protein
MSRAECQKYGMDLAMIEDPLEQKYVSNWVLQTGKNAENNNF